MFEQIVWTPTLLTRLHPLGGIVEANALKSLRRECKGRRYRR